MDRTILKILTLVLFILGIAGQLITISPSGSLKNGDILFWSSHGHDSMWHIAVSNEIKKGFPLQNPVFAGEKLVNYHIFSDILPALINTAFKIPNLIIYFWIMPIVYSFLLGAAAYFAGKEIGKSKLAGIFSVFSVYFIGSFGYIVTLIKGRGLGGESLFWATQVQSSIGNPPQILSDILILALIYTLTRYFKGRTFKGGGKLIFFLTTLSLAKIYAGVVVLPAFAVLTTYRILKYKKFDFLFILLTSCFLILILYLPFTKSAGRYFIFEPLWYARKLFSDPERIGISNFDLIIQHYQSLVSLKSKLGFARYDLLGLSLMLFGNLGIRSLGFLSIPRLFKQNKEITLLLTSVAAFSFLIPNLFLQKGVATNTSQTLQYLLLVFGLFFAVAMTDLFSKIKRPVYKLIFLSLIVLFSVPTQIGLIHEFYSRPAFAKIPKAEVEALNYLKYIITKNDVVLTPPYDPYLDTKEVPPPIWDWFDTSYVAAMTEGSVYFADYEQVDIMGYDYAERSKIQKTIFQTGDPNQVTNLLINKPIDYIYFPKPLAPKTDFSKIGNLQKIFENREVEIWRINQPL